MLKIRIYRTKYRNSDGYFQHEDIKLASWGTWKGRVDAGVNLGRSGLTPKCDTLLSALQAHNGEAPIFKSEAEADLYVTRICNDINQFKSNPTPPTVHRRRRRVDNVVGDEQS